MRHQPRWTSPAAAATLFVLLLACRSEGAGPQSPGEIPTSRAPIVTEPTPEEGARTGLALVCEVYCSETELRTALARLSWRVVPGSEAEAPAERSATTPRRIDATVFKDGFEKDLYVSLPVSQEESEGATPSATAARQGQGELRAFQIRLADVDPPESAPAFARGEEESAVVIENLEPGMSYTWRLVMERAGAASPTVTCQAPVCPADMVREGPR